MASAIAPATVPQLQDLSPKIVLIAWFSIIQGTTLNLTWHLIFTLDFMCRFSDDSIQYKPCTNPMHRWNLVMVLQSKSIEIIYINSYFRLSTLLTARITGLWSFIYLRATYSSASVMPSFSVKPQNDGHQLLPWAPCLVLDLFHKWSINIINSSSINHTERTVTITSSRYWVPCDSFDIFYDWRCSPAIRLNRVDFQHWDVHDGNSWYTMFSHFLQ